MDSPGGASSSSASAARRTAGSLRGARMQSGLITPQQMESGDNSPRSSVKEDNSENDLNDQDTQNVHDDWDPADFMAPPNVALTPPGAMIELPSIPVNSSRTDEIRDQDSAPWMSNATSQNPSTDYDWANFVYAYSRGRWDPSRLPRPPNQSNIYPGTTTRINVIQSEVEPTTDPKEEGPSHENLVVRRPSLDYVDRPGLAHRVFSEPDRRTINMSSHTPPPMNNTTLSDIRERATSSIMSATKGERNDEKSDTGPLSTGPQFIDPFRMLQIASSSSAPQVGQLTALGDFAQRIIDREQNVTSKTPVGSKTDGEVMKRNNVVRLPSDPSHQREMSNEARILSGRAEVMLSLAQQRRTSTQSTKTTPSLSASTITATRPALAAQVSELSLHANHTSRGNDVKGSEIDSSREKDTDSPRRPDPVPMQSHGSDNLENDQKVPEHLQDSVKEDQKLVALTAAESEEMAFILKDMSEPVQGKESKDTLQLGSEVKLPDEGVNNACINNFQILATKERANSGGDGAGSGSVRKAHQFDQEGPSRRSSVADVSRHMPGILSLVGPTNSSPTLSTHVGLGRRIEAFYKQHGYLPAMMPPDEIERRQAIRRYGPPSVRGNINFERIAHLVKLVFNTKLVLISLVGEETQFFQTEVGAQALGYTKDWLQKIAAPRDCSMCAHAILQPTDEPLVILDTVKDWRFAGNPLVIGEPKIRFYAGTPLRTSDGHNLGTLCIIDDQPWTDFNPRYRHTLREFGRVAMREMELIRETIHLRTQDRMQHSIESFTRECIEMESIESDEDEKEQKQGLHQVYALAAKSMCEALQATGAIVFDLSQFELVVSPVNSKMGKDGLEAGADGQIFIPSSPYQFPEGSNSFSQRQSNVNSRASSPPLPDNLQTSSSEERKVPAMAVLGACESQQPPANREMNVPISSYHRVANFLRRYRTGYFYPYVPAPFRQYLPTNTSNVLLVPIFGLNRQPFALLCAYSHQTDDGPTLEDFKESGLQYLRAMGTIILSAILKKDIMLADKAKSHFISNISHELRTPLHGILAAAELLNETKLNSTQGSYLETVEACGKSLLELVNHVLDFTKLSGNFHAKQMAVKPSQRCDLVKLVQEVCESSWIGQMAKNLESQQNAGIGSAYAHGSEISSSRSSLENDDRKIHLNAGYNNLVETVIDVSMRKSGWLVKCDAGGIRRVLMNLIGNSLKFTSKGFVHVSLREVQSTDKHVLVELGVTDTGKGISRSFLEEQLFHPFTQENHLGPGTGLGLSIVNSIVQSPAINGKIDVWSTVGQGTEIRVTCELELGESEEAEGPIYTPVLNVEHQRSVSFLGFDTEMRGQSDLKDVLKSYFEDWWRFEFLESVDKGDLVLINDDINLVNKVLAKRSSPLPPIILLTGARGSSALNEICDEYQRRGGIVRLLFKPAGPAKLEAVTDFCLQCFERGQAGLPMVDISSAHTTPLPSPAISKDDSSQKDYFITSHEMSTDDAITPKGPPAISTSKTTESSARPTIRPKLSNDLRRNSHHISPGPPTDSESALIRRHSSEGRTGKVNVVRENDGSVHTSTADPTLASGNAFPKTSTGFIDSNFVDANASSRPLMPTRSITYHEPRLQRHVLMSPLRSPHYRRANNDGYLSGEAMDYFGPAANAGTIQGTYFDGYNHAGSNSTNSNPNSPGSVISLEGGEGAVLRTAIHTAGLMRNHHSINSNHQAVNTPGSNAKSKKRLQILSVEDNSINRKVLAAFFAKMDVDLVEATNGEEGVRVFETYPPFHFDVIFMDLSMPVLDGIGAMTQIRKIEAERFKHEQGSTMAWLRATRTGTGMGNGKNAGSNASTGSLNSSSSSISQSSSITTTTNAATILGTPGGSRPSAQARAKIFALTGRSSDVDKRRAFAMGADGFIVKPLSYKVLSSLINTISVYKGTVPTTTSNHLGASNLNTQSTTTTTTTQSGIATSRGV